MCCTLFAECRCTLQWRRTQGTRAGGRYFLPRCSPESTLVCTPKHQVCGTDLCTTCWWRHPGLGSVWWMPYVVAFLMWRHRSSAFLCNLQMPCLQIVPWVFVMNYIVNCGICKSIYWSRKYFVPTSSELPCSSQWTAFELWYFLSQFAGVGCILCQHPVNCLAVASELPCVPWCL